MFVLHLLTDIIIGAMEPYLQIMLGDRYMYVKGE